jgi:hypothetical protein
MTRTLLAFGDSHTAGAEIEEHYNYECYHKAYPACIANYYGIQYKNYSQAGCSNDWLVKRFIDVIKKAIINKEEVFVLFNFCESSRTHIEIPIPPESQQNWDEEFYGSLHFYSNHLSKKYFNDVEKNPYTQALKKYLPIYRTYLTLNTNKDLSKKAINQIFLVQTICKKYNIPFVFHNSISWYSGDWSLISKKNHFGHHSSDIWNYDSENINNSMYMEYCFWGLATNHPNWKHLYFDPRWKDHYPEEYHKYWASKLLRFIDNQKILEGYI